MRLPNGFGSVYKLKGNRRNPYMVVLTKGYVRAECNIKREKVPNCLEICRRFITDEKDFSDINFDYITFDNNDDRNRGFYGILNLSAVKDFLTS